MAPTASAVRVGTTGSVYFAPTGTTVPTTVAGALDAAFLEVGYATDNGITITPDTDVKDIRAWQNGQLVRKVQTKADWSVKFGMLETSERSLLLYFGNYTHGLGAINGVAVLNAGQPYRGVFVINVVDDVSLTRLVIPDGQVTDRGDISIVNGDAISYEITVTGYPDASGQAGYQYVETLAAS